MKKALSLFFLFFFIASADSTKPPEGETIVLLHGLGRTRGSMKKLEKYFLKQGYQVHNLGYPSRKNTIQKLTEGFLTEALKTHGTDAKKLHFVTHSLGGILIRTYLQREKIPNLGRIVMLGPPNQGCHVTDRLNKWFLYRWFTGPAGQQLGTNPYKSVPLNLKQVEAEIGIIAGTRSWNPFFSSLIPGPDDGKVAVSCTKLSNMKDFLALPVTHTFMMQNKTVITQAHHFLKNGQFSRE